MGFVVLKLFFVVWVVVVEYRKIKVMVMIDSVWC